MGLREIACQYAWGFQGLPYVWGGDDPLAGFDCAGYVIEILKAVGLLPHVYSSVAGGLYAKWIDHALAPPGRAGGLVFWFVDNVFTPENCQHVVFQVAPGLCLGASSGGSSTLDLGDAIRQNAFVKLRPISYWGPGRPFKIVDPFWEVDP